MQDLTDVVYEVDDGLATITINRPERFNSFRARTVDELIACFKRAWASADVGVVCLTGAGDRAFCSGGDQKQRAETGDYGPSVSGLFEIEALHRVIRDIPKPVIAAVNGYAIGGGPTRSSGCRRPRSRSSSSRSTRTPSTSPRSGRWPTPTSCCSPTPTKPARALRRSTRSATPSSRRSAPAAEPGTTQQAADLGDQATVSRRTCRTRG